MYAGLFVTIGEMEDNGYYDVAKQLPSPLTDAFDASYFERLCGQAKQNLSAKAFLATEQRIPGLGNGVLQDILFNAGIHPKTKLGRLTDTELSRMFASVKDTLMDMTLSGGRDTEKDLYACLGGYKSRLSRNTLSKPCPKCGGPLVREAYLGGNIYFCPTCQPPNK